MNASNRTILLAEDDPEEAFLMRRAFQKADFKIPLRVVRDGQEAIDYLSHTGDFADTRDHPLPALMLLDLKMPRRNGFEVLQWLRQQAGLKQLIVIVLSSSGEMADINRAYDLGANSYLIKPGDFETLINLVKTLEAYWLNLNLNVDPRMTDNPATLVPHDQHITA